MKNLLPMSGKLIPEFDRRRNIRDMFSRKPSVSIQNSFGASGVQDVNRFAKPVLPTTPGATKGTSAPPEVDKDERLTSPVPSPVNSARAVGTKRTQKSEAPIPAAKKSKSASQPGALNGSGKSQRSLKGFFKANSTLGNEVDGATDDASIWETHLALVQAPTSTLVDGEQKPINGSPALMAVEKAMTFTSPGKANPPSESDRLDPIASKQSWGKLFTKPVSPMCEHNEPCKTMLTKKPGVNCGRSFWMCNRPLGPSGNKEKGTQWRCHTFIWASDWTGAPSTSG